MNWIVAMFRNLFFLCFVISCAHMRSGQYVYWPKSKSLKTLSQEQGVALGKIKKSNPRLRRNSWVFIPNDIGLTRLTGERSVVRDGSFVSGGRFIWPVPGKYKISSGFGHRRGRKHEGIDIPAKTGTPIVAIANGKVKYSGNGISGYGNLIIIEHPGKIFSVYAHNSKNLVRKGNRVSKGEKIGLVGSTGRSTGPHLHFEIRVKDKARNPSSFLKNKFARSP